MQNPAGTTHDLTLGFSYNPASQIISNTRSNDTYAWTGHGSGTLSSPTNGLNQLTSHNGGSVTHDAKGNITYDPTNGQGYGYSSENLLTSVNGGSWTGTLLYDPAMRLYEAGVNSKTRFVHDGHTRIAEYSSSGAQTARYVHGPGIDEPLVAYSGSGLATRSFLHADERGTIVARSDDAGNVVSVGRYDEYGKTQNFANRFGFAGMPYETVSQLYYARARMYNPRISPRFMQPDPIGYDDGMNMYVRTKGDPVNFTDPTGLFLITPRLSGDEDEEENEPDRSYDTRTRSYDGMGISSLVRAAGGRLEAMAYERAERAWKELLASAQRTFRGGGGSFGGGGATGSWSDCGCLEEGTLVTTPTGLRPIEQIAVGDLVLAVNEATGEIAAKPVTDLIRPEPKPLYALKLRDASGEIETFHATDDHPWRVEGKGWVETLDLKAGDRIDTASGADMVVTSLTLTSRIEQTYNLTVADWHTFMVGEDQAVVHNACLPKSLQRKLGNLAGRAGERAGAVAKERGASAANLNKMGHWRDASLQSIAEAAARGDQSAERALKIVKQGVRLGQRY
jgi:RHS repeat-associated protein